MGYFARYTIAYMCDAPMFMHETKPFDQIPDEHKEIVASQDGLPCDGGLVPGTWCGSCHYFGWKEEESTDIFETFS